MRACLSLFLTAVQLPGCNGMARAAPVTYHAHRLGTVLALTRVRHMHACISAPIVVGVQRTFRGA